MPPVTLAMSALRLSITLCPRFPALMAPMLFAIVPSIPPLNTLALKPLGPIHAHTFSGAIPPI